MNELFYDISVRCNQICTLNVYKKSYIIVLKICKTVKPIYGGLSYDLKLVH